MQCRCLPAEKFGWIVGAAGGRQLGLGGDRDGDRGIRRQRVLDAVAAVDELQRSLRWDPKLKLNVKN